MEVYLSKTEQKLAEYVAKKRYRYNRDNGIEDGKIGPQSAEMTDLNGIGGELAFCKAMNIYPDITTGDGQPKFDCVIGKSRWDVKTTTYPDGRLLVLPTKASKRCEFYALVTGRFPSYKIAGWTSAEEVFHSSTLMDLGHGMTHAIDQEELYFLRDIRK
jgi:hypothetical protein